MIYCMSRQEVLTNCGSVGTGRRARLRILWAMRSCGFKSHLPHLTLGKPCKSQIYRAFLYFNFTMYSFFTRKSVLKFSERLTSIRKEYFHKNCHVRSEIQASQTCAYLNWVILGTCASFCSTGVSLLLQEVIDAAVSGKAQRFAKLFMFTLVYILFCAWFII